MLTYSMVIAYCVLWWYLVEITSYHHRVFMHEVRRPAIFISFYHLWHSSFACAFDPVCRSSTFYYVFLAISFQRFSISLPILRTHTGQPLDVINACVKLTYFKIQFIQWFSQDPHGECCQLSIFKESRFRIRIAGWTVHASEWLLFWHKTVFIAFFT